MAPSAVSETWAVFCIRRGCWRPVCGATGVGRGGQQARGATRRRRLGSASIRQPASACFSLGEREEAAGWLFSAVEASSKRARARLSGGWVRARDRRSGRSGFRRWARTTPSRRSRPPIDPRAPANRTHRPRPPRARSAPKQASPPPPRQAPSLPAEPAPRAPHPMPSPRPRSPSASELVPQPPRSSVATRVRRGQEQRC